MTDQDRSLVRISFETIQQSPRDLAETMAQKMYREAPGLLAAPPYVGPTMFTMIRHEEARPQMRKDYSRNAADPNLRIGGHYRG